MIEKTFLDRVPTHPGRVIMTPVTGQVNTYDMARADNPTEEGTPLDKAAFDSIIQSRLTGRYYELTAEKTVLSSLTGITLSPIPANSWIYQTGGIVGNSGSWTVESSSIAAAGYNPGGIFDGDSTSSWRSASATTSWVSITSGVAIKIKNFKLNFANAGHYTMQMQGSNNETDWTTLVGLTPGEYSYTIENPAYYLYYRLYFVSSSAVNTSVVEWQITEYDATTYTMAYTADGLTDQWNQYQRVTVVTPPDALTVGVVSNTLNGVNINAILQPNTRYHLIHDGNNTFLVE